MPINRELVTETDAALEALLGLAHATRSIDDPEQIYPVLGAVSAGLVALEQSLHQLANRHDSAAAHGVRVDGDGGAGRAAVHQVAWELHRAAEMVREVGAAVDHAHEIEATIAYPAPPPRPAPAVGAARPGPGMSL
ncbi:hypothetical protein [Nocardioides sp. YIM 152588]|uniref:hypothetical protein n=1 Tax=Nocardioides sp. YIM 152588 TaxID=3158259 RepID=UPI0032E44899